MWLCEENECPHYTRVLQGFSTWRLLRPPITQADKMLGNAQNTKNKTREESLHFIEALWVNKVVNERGQY